MFGACPCVSAREAVFALAFLVCAAVWSPIFFGADFGTLWAAFIKTPLDPPLIFAVWGTTVVCSLVVLVVGIRQNIEDGHGAPVLSSLVTILACAVAIHNQWYLPRTINPRMPYFTEAVYIALIAACCANLCMAYAARVRRLRLTSPARLQRAYTPDEAASAEYRDVLAAFAERDAEHRRKLAESARQIEVLTARLAARQIDTSEYERLVAENREMKAVLAFPGLKAAILHALHSDHHIHAAARERSARDEAVGKLMAVYKRIGVDR
jgi:hypothetical protein